MRHWAGALGDAILVTVGKAPGDKKLQACICKHMTLKNLINALFWEWIWLHWSTKFQCKQFNSENWPNYLNGFLRMIYELQFCIWQWSAKPSRQTICGDTIELIERLLSFSARWMAVRLRTLPLSAAKCWWRAQKQTLSKNCFGPLWFIHYLWQIHGP